MTLFEKLNEEQIDVNMQLGKSLHGKISNARSSRGSRTIMRPALAFTVLALSILVVNQGLRYEQGKEISFIERALAVSYEQDSLLKAGLVRHMVIEYSGNGMMPTRHESWIDGETFARFEKNIEVQTGNLIGEYLIKNGIGFWSPEMAEKIRIENEQNAERQVEDITININFPENEAGGSSSTEAVEGGWKTCYTPEAEPTKQMEDQAQFMQEAENALFGNDLELPNTPRAIQLLAQSAFVADIGEEDNELGRVHIYRLTVNETRDGELVETGSDYVFDANTSRLIQVRRWYGDPLQISEGSSEITIVTDEVVARETVPSEWFDEKVRGFVAFWESGNTDPRPQVTVPGAGCYMIDGKTLEVTKL